ncbi:GNAT family N-acetyltransferase [Salinisphaera aquimarina]|uniref:GNAT family N-acetyltransferase n=1 Tax=Salinisphaera aquimarina TaxID=2094031 RepID=A0ABV7EU52_9GAMM
MSRAVDSDTPSDGVLPVTLRAIDTRNWQTCIHLELEPEQARKLASNLYSLAEAYVEPRCTPMGIYAGVQMIGFVMFEWHPATHTYSIPRFMIDRRWQGGGYGARALQAIIDTLKGEQPDAPILISLTPDNMPARRLYERLGFVDTKHRLHGEDVLRYA